MTGPRVAAAGQLTDPERLRQLRETGLLLGDDQPSLDRLTRTAAEQAKAPVALVSLVAVDRQFIASQVGLPEPWATRGQTPLSHSFCRHVVTGDAALIVSDARTDPRVWDSPAITDLGILAYAGFPLHTPDGSVLGAFCVIDIVARVWAASELALVAALAAAVETEIALRLANRDLLRASQRMGTVLDTAQDAYVAAGPDGRITAWNAAAERLFGFAAAEAVGRTVADLIVPERLRAAHHAGIAGIRAGRASQLAGQRLQLAAINRAGEEFPVEMTLQVIDELGAPTFHAFLHDITDQHRAEILREAQFAVARALADAANAKEAATGTVAAVASALDWAYGEFWLTDPDHETVSRIGSWTRPGLDLGAFSGGGQITFRRGEGLAGIVWATDAELWIPEVADDPRTAGRREPARWAGLHTAIGLPVRSDGHTLGVLLFFNSAREVPDAELLAMLDGVCAHLGRHFERRRAEDLTLALAAARRNFERAIAQIKDFVWTLEILPDGTVKAVYRNSDSNGIFGGELPYDDDLLPDVMAAHVHPDDTAAMAALRAAVSAGDPGEAEVRILGMDGVTRWVWIRSTLRVENGRRFVDGSATDVTDRRELSEQREHLLADQRRQNRQLRDLDRMKDELVALVSHELRNPLSLITAYTEMLLADPALSGDPRELVSVIERHSAHMNVLVDDLLEMARLEAGKADVDPRPVPLARLVLQSAQGSRPAADAKRLTLTVQVPRHLHVYADPVRFRQVLDNLVSNAVKYTPAGGEITIRGRGEERAGRATAVLTVTDTGIGIPPEEYEHLFDRFFRASNAVAKGIKGTGLGLAITKAIVEAHAGSISAEP
ncbi:MAG: hypothetical protein QOE51_2678, partial [Actinoplanes sp.]|nr:hypothetical protein [Actinoplanes sp.]